jgi:signal transduction histidine kinase
MGLIKLNKRAKIYISLLHNKIHWKVINEVLQIEDQYNNTGLRWFIPVVFEVQIRISIDSHNTTTVF